VSATTQPRRSSKKEHARALKTISEVAMPRKDRCTVAWATGGKRTALQAAPPRWCGPRWLGRPEATPGGLANAAWSLSSCWPRQRLTW